MAFVAGQKLTAADLNFPIFRARQTAAQTLTTAIYTPITLTTEDVDTHNGHSTVSNTSRYVAQRAGRYSCAGNLAFAASATGGRYGEWAVNGVLIPNSDNNQLSVGGGAASRMDVPNAIVTCGVGDYIELWGMQDTGGNLNTFAASNIGCAVNINYIG